MKETAEISFYLDKRRAKKGGFPLKLHVYLNRESRRWYYLNMDITADQFQRSYLAEKPRGEHKELKIELETIVARANEIAKRLGSRFTFDRFEREMFGGRHGGNDVIKHFEMYMESLKEQERAGSADFYRLSIRSIKDFAGKGRKKEITRLPFETITPEFLIKYEKWMQGNGRSRATTGIYLRSLRAIFNQAIQAGDISADIYPFKKGKYTIPSGKNVKKALEKEDIHSLYYAEVPPGSEMEKARDFWFFSYQCSGMNFRDIAELKYKDIGKRTFSFIRHKTIHTTKDNPKPIIVPLTDKIKSVIDKYGNERTSADEYVFPIFKKGMDEFEKLRVNRNFIRFVNQHMKKLAESIGLDANMTTYVARHTFTTASIRGGAAMEFIQESLGHQSLATTQNYWAGFEEKVKKEMAEALMDF